LKRISHFFRSCDQSPSILYDIFLDNGMKLDMDPIRFKSNQTISVEWKVNNLYYDQKEIPSIKGTKKISEQISLLDCLNSWSNEEKLGANDPWYCPTCKDFKEATKKLDLWKLPKILIIHLKRFANKSWKEKNNSFVDFPLEDLDLPFLSGKKSEVYDLFAVSNHYGSMSGGHYTSYCKNNGKWYEFDDSSVSTHDESRVKTKNAYVLFYRRKSQTN